MNNKETAKKRMMFIQKEDYNFLTYIMLLLLYTLDCSSESKKFRDFRKIAYLVDFINFGGEISKYNQNDLANIYSKAQLKKQLLSHLIVVLKNQKYIDVDINTTHQSIDLWLNKENIPSGFFDKKLFEEEIKNVIALKQYAHSLKTVTVKNLVDTIFTNNNVITWEI